MSNPLQQKEAELYADLIVPAPVPNLYTYSIPDHLKGLVHPGFRVIVRFGKKKIVTAVVAHIHNNPPQVYETKDIMEVLDDEPTMNSFQLRMLHWMQDYYLSTPGEVLNAALPSGLKVHSQSWIQLNSSYSGDYPFSDTEENIIGILQIKLEITFDELAKMAGIKNIFPHIKSLLAKEKIVVFEEVKEKFTPKTIKKIKLSPLYEDQKNLQNLFLTLEKKPQQTDVLLHYLKQVPIQKNSEGLEKKRLVEVTGADSTIRTLVKKEIFEEFEEVVSRFGKISKEKQDLPVLSEHQESARQEIMKLFQNQETVLLHGITGSGKTEIFIHLITQALQSGMQVLYLLPEIALTTQMVVRLKKVFGDKMGIYHSKFSVNERVETWKGIISGRFSFVIGVRSSIFLPFDNLGLIIVDEEHETSYKQQEPAPRYHARDTALVLAKMHGAKTLLASATPSIESYHLCLTGRRGLVTLNKRFGDTPLPEIIISDTRRAKKFKEMHNDFSPMVLGALEECLKNKEQAIIFRNRRGFSPYLTCEECAHVFKCTNCDVSLTYHMHSNNLRCHYCGYREEVAKECHACGSTRIATTGFGTEKIEQDLSLLLPNAKISRMDTDTVRSKNGYEKIIKAFESKETDILIGTQMVSKGFDFGNVSTVAIMDADQMLNFPDFRSFEKTFQLLVQVSGRAGRRDKRGKVIIQSSDPQHRILKKVIDNDYTGLFKEELAERETFLYPPFSRIIKITIRHTDRNLAERAAYKLVNLLRPNLGNHRVLGPEWPIISKIRNYYLINILLKLEKNKVDIPYAKQLIKKETVNLLNEKTFRQIQVIFDVDPV
ncbi:primosomal protein N' [Cytophagaceae bacterium ABcell3]|nr:primosomal protein N' [Cytophagaceae bacterium ABcell3]